MDAALLDEIRAHPEADAPRLVLADALQAKGDPRGELIAVQCELTRAGAPHKRVFQDWIDDACVDADVSTLRKRETALLRNHGAKWTREARAFAVPDGVTLRRGFVERIRWDCRQHLSRGLAPLVAAAPLLAALEFATDHRTGSLAKFYADPNAQQLRELYIPGDATGLEDAKLALTRLAVGHVGGPHPLRRIAKTAWFGRLRGLVLTGFTLDVDDIAAIARPRELVELQLISSRCALAGAEMLGSSIDTTKLEILALRHANLAAGDIAKLLRAHEWPSLAALDLRSNELGERDIAAIVCLPRLRVLNVANTRLDYRAAQILIRSGLALRKLDARSNLLRANVKKLLAKTYPHSKRTI